MVEGSVMVWVTVSIWSHQSSCRDILDRRAQGRQPPPYGVLTMRQSLVEGWQALPSE